MLRWVLEVQAGPTGGVEDGASLTCPIPGSSVSDASFAAGTPTWETEIVTRGFRPG
jgi:hypothetical protein